MGQLPSLLTDSVRTCERHCRHAERYTGFALGWPFVRAYTLSPPRRLCIRTHLQGAGGSPPRQNFAPPVLAYGIGTVGVGTDTAPSTIVLGTTPLALLAPFSPRPLGFLGHER
jgi:hypothetical protein